METLKKLMVIGLATSFLVGCQQTGAEGIPEEEKEATEHKEVKVDRDLSWKLGKEQFTINGKEEKTHANYLGDIELGEDWSPELPTKRREGVYKPSKLEDGVWHWELDENAPRGHHVPFNNKGNI